MVTSKRNLIRPTYFRKPNDINQKAINCYQRQVKQIKKKLLKFIRVDIFLLLLKTQLTPLIWERKMFQFFFIQKQKKKKNNLIVRKSSKRKRKIIFLIYWNLFSYYNVFTSFFLWQFNRFRFKNILRIYFIAKQFGVSLNKSKRIDKGFLQKSL